MKVFRRQTSTDREIYPAERCAWREVLVDGTSQGVAPAAAGSLTTAGVRPFFVDFYTGATTAGNAALTIRLDTTGTTVDYGYIGKNGRYVQESLSTVTA